ncbi:non-ribosomal peptide synthetase, partial [Crossiella equi]|uniref:non-ribosomal peptide synthetase n=1 Tax=Crossiella equi TaxID=130796 RepID=UPI0013023DAE
MPFAGLRAVAREHRVTPFMLLVAATQVLLGRYTGQSDLAVATAVAERGRPETDHLTGLLVNTVILRATVSDDEPFVSLLHRVRDTTLEAFEHAELPFQHVVETLNLDRDPSRPPLAEVSVALHGAPLDHEIVPGLHLRELRPPTPVSTMDIAVDAYDLGDTLELRLTYNTELFTAPTIERFGAHLSRLLAGIAAAPDTPVGDLPMTTATEAHVLTELWPREGVGQRPRTIVELFADQVRRTPDAVAVVADEGLATPATLSGLPGRATASPDGTEPPGSPLPEAPAGRISLTYAQLDTLSTRLAHLLAARGAGPERIVALALPRGVDLVVAELAVARTGAAFLPLDGDNPPERLRLMLDDARPVLLVTGSGFPHDLGYSPVLHLSHPGVAVQLSAGSVAPLAVAVTVGHAAYVIFTSGSTGRPKGVVVTHRGVHGLVAAQSARFRTGEGSRVLRFASPAFDAAFSELGMALFTGGAVVVAGKEAMLPGEPLAGLVSRQGVTHVTLPPSALPALRPDAFPRDLVLVVAGEACPPALAAQWAGRHRVVNAYGPTESTVCATMSEPLDGTSVPMGRPLDGVRTYVLDGRLRAVPVGVPGELYLGGAALARGYLGRAGLTAASFVAHPGGERLYRTGDRVRWRADGNLEYLGRTDDQVKLRGFRVEPGEVEAALSTHPEVRAAAVVVRADHLGTRRLVGYAVTPAAVAPRLRDYLRERLPEHMVPAVVVALDELPRTPNGKVDRRALPEPPRQELSARVAPRTDVERVLADIWAGLLGIEVGVTDNFFDLGGDSILGLRVVARARDAGLHLTARHTFLRQTIAELAREATPLARAGSVDTPVTGPVRATPIIRWFQETLVASRDRFNQAVLVELPADTDAVALDTALRALVRHHDALRLRMPDAAAGSPLVHAQPGDEPVLREPHLHPDQVREATLAAQLGFDLVRGPLFRATLFRAGTTRLHLVAHHLVVDGISWRVLLADLDTAYRQVLGGQPVDLGAKTTSFQDWAERLAEHTAAGGFDHELPHWQAVEAAAVAALPVDGHGPNTVEHARTVTVRLTAPETEALLRAVPPVYRTQVNDVLLSALAHSLRQWSGGSTARIALEGHGREDLFAEVDLSRTVGWFTTVYPVLLSLPDGDWGQVLKAVKEQLRAVPGNGIGYGALRHLAGAGLTGGPEVSFNYLGRLDESRDLLPTEGAERAPHQERHHLIEVNGEVSGGQLTFDLTYASTRHHEHTVRALADGFTAALREIIAHCARPGAGGATPSDFPLAALDQSTVDRLVGDGRAVSDLYPLTPGQSGMLFHSLAEAGRDLYTGHFGVRLDGITDPAALAEAWRAAVARTPALRSAVVWQDVPEPLQVVHTTAELPITHHDLSTLDGDAQAAALAELWRRQRRTVLDLATAPLLRLTIVRLSGTAVQLFWSSHHLVLDGWSFTHLLTDVLALHAGTTPVTRRPYREHVRRLAELDPAEAEKHWRGVVGDLTAPTPLPLDRAPARAHDTRSSVELTHRLSTTDTTRLLEVARAQRVTLNTLVQGAWAVLLARHGGDRDVCFGATVSGRADGEEIIGLFINTVPVRVRVEEDRAAADWLRELQHAQAAGRDHEHVALSQIQRWSGVPAGTGLFDSIVVFENYPYDHEAAARQGVRIGEYLGDEHTNYALTLTAHLTGDLHLSLGYDPDLLRAASAQTLLDRLRTVLLGLARAPEAPLGRLRLHTGADVVPGADIAYGPPGLVHELFAAQAARTPDAIAVTGPDGELGFAELDRRANRLAHRLRALGARPGVLVGVCLARGAAAVVALLGVLKSGAAFVPLDPAHPSQRLRVMLEDAAAPIVVTDARHLHLAGDAVTVLLEDPGLAAEPATAPASGACPADLAYVCYTSGTTGRPKGVLVEHRHVHHMVRAWDTRHGLAGTAPVALNVSSLSVDLFLGDFLLSALFGGRLVVCPQDQVADQVALTDLLLDSGATLMVTVPALARAMAAELRWRGVRPEALRLLLVGSEGFATEAAREILDALAPGATLVNAYGSTETTVDSTHFPADPDTLGEAAFTPVGHVLANTWIAVLDDRLRPVPPGVTGECYIGGDGVSRGYHDRPGLTSGRFVADPCRPGKRLYRTGDLVRVRADGALECLGRVDDQVKVGGFRVELGEVEAALDRHPAVRAAAARLVRTEAGTRLVGYVVGEGLDLKAVKEFVTAALPPAAVPALLVELPALPLTTSGTVDRRALPVPGAAQVARTAFVAPRSSTERVLAQVWAEVLGVPRVGVHDNFFELGGDSVLSIRVISRLRSALGVAPSPRQLFDTPTVAGLAGVLGTDSGPRTGPGRAVGAGAPGGPLAGPVRLAGDGPAPLSFAQLRMWFHQEFAPESAEYNIVTALEIEGALEESALRAALTAVVARHDTLRTTYTTVAEVRPPSAVPLPVR